MTILTAAISGLIIIICVVLYACIFVGAGYERTEEDQP